MKSPGVAALLNAFPLVLGLGYIYLGLWRRFAVSFGLQIVLGLIVARGARELAVGLTLLWFGSILDAHKQAKALNARLASEARSDASDGVAGTSASTL